MLHGERLSKEYLPALHNVERLAAAAFIITSDPVVHTVEAATVSQAAEWLDAAALATAESRPAPALSMAGAPQPTLLARLATSQLRTEIEHVAATAQ
jgi:hypothetical protein